MFSFVICCSTAASTVAVCESSVSVQTTGVQDLRAAPRHTPCLAQHERRTVSFTRRTHWRNNARLLATRKLCAQHKCRPQGGGQRTTALVADIITVEVQDRQRRIGLVKIERSCHGVAWSTHLRDVDHHVCATTPDAKLVELLHFMPCPCVSWTPSLQKESRVVFSRVNLCHTPVSRYGISYHVVSFTGLWNAFTTSQLIT